MSEPACAEAPRADALVSVCAPPSGEQDAPAIATVPAPATITLALSSGTPLRIAVDKKVRVDHPGEMVHGRVVETVYAFDQPLIPAGSVATGRVTKIDPVPGFKRAMAYSNGNLTPVHKYEVTFDTLILPDGKQLAIKTTVTPGTAEVVHLVSNPDKANQKGAAGRATDAAKHEAKGKIQEAKKQVHDSWAQVTAPGKMHRLHEILVAQLPYRRQYIEPGTRFVADLNEPLTFGETTRTGEQLAQIGTEPTPDSTLKARLVAEVSSATASRGTPVTAILTEPLYSPEHQLILPSESRLVGQVLRAKPAHKLHHNGQLRVIFERIEIPEQALEAAAATKPQVEASQVHLENRSNPKSQAMIGNLEGVEVDRASNMKLDEEGGARTTDSKKRYLSTGLAILVAATASNADAERGSVDAAGDPGVRTVAGASGARWTGALLSLVAKSTPVSIAFGVYGASSSIYANFLARGHDVVLPKDTPLEIGVGAPHATPGQSQPKTN
jgi:hypothetical protein